jgi:hypothetical protein
VARSVDSRKTGQDGRLPDELAEIHQAASGRGEKAGRDHGLQSVFEGDAEDWDIAVALQFKNHAALDGLAAKGEELRDKILGGKQALQEVTDKRSEIREIVSSDLMQEVSLK